MYTEDLAMRGPHDEGFPVHSTTGSTEQWDELLFVCAGADSSIWLNIDANIAAVEHFGCNQAALNHQTYRCHSDTNP